jgi:hypothetical protein
MIETEGKAILIYDASLKAIENSSENHSNDDYDDKD